MKPAVLTLLAVLTLTGRASAEPFTHPAETLVPRPKPHLEERWYGWQILATEAAGYGVAALTLTAHSPNTTFHVALGTYWGAGPLVHALHGRFGYAAASLGVRVLLPVGFGAPFLATGSANAAAFGLVTGAIVAEFIDVAAFAKEPVMVDVARVRISPDVAVLPSGTLLGVRGVF